MKEIITIVIMVIFVAFALKPSNFIEMFSGRPSDIEIKMQILKAQLEWMKTPEYKAHQKSMWELQKARLPKIYESTPFSNSYWVKSTKETKK